MELDLYCKGMLFGLNGSKLLVKIANNILKTGNKEFGIGDLNLKSFGKIWKNVKKVFTGVNDKLAGKPHGNKEEF